MARTARRLGIHSTLHARPSIALGTGEVTLLELTGAYAPFANGGQGVLPHLITRVRDGDGRVLYRRQRSTTGQVARSTNVGAMNDMLNATITLGSGKQAAIEGHEAGGKTGTTQSFRDAWFVGYTAHYVGGVWIGNDGGTRMKKVTGGTLPGQAMARSHGSTRTRTRPRCRCPACAVAGLREAVAALPWFNPKSDGNTPLLQRVLSIFSRR